MAVIQVSGTITGEVNQFTDVPGLNTTFVPFASVTWGGGVSVPAKISTDETDVAITLTPPSTDWVYRFTGIQLLVANTTVGSGVNDFEDIASFTTQWDDSSDRHSWQQVLLGSVTGRTRNSGSQITLRTYTPPANTVITQPLLRLQTGLFRVVDESATATNAGTVKIQARANVYTVEQYRTYGMHSDVPTL